MDAPVCIGTPLNWMVCFVTQVRNISHNTRDYLPNNDNDSYGMLVWRNFLNGANKLAFAVNTSNVCKAPFVESSKNGFCAAPCPGEDAIMERQYLTAFRVIAYLSLTVQYLCSFIIFYTWAKARKLYASVPAAVVKLIIILTHYYFYFLVGNSHT
jgi:hypothetical protein